MAVRDTLLLACGTAASRNALRTLFEDSFHILEAGNGAQTMLFLEQNYLCIAAVLLDTTQETQDSVHVLSEMSNRNLLEDIPVLLIADENTPHTAIHAFEQGVSDIVFSNYDPTVLSHRLRTIVELFRHKWNLQDVIQEHEKCLRHSSDAIVDALSSIIEHRSVESGQHILRVRHFTKILLEDIAHSCPEYSLTEDMITIISSASALHDVGKIAIPDAILNKPGKLTAEEWEVMKSHTISGCQIIETLDAIGNTEYLRYAHNICHYHHERWNGEGYPEGIAGDAIPICAQVVGLADVYDALTTKRIYKDAVSHEQAVNMIINGECGVFSPKLIACFKHVAHNFKILAEDYADGISPKSENFDVELPGPEYRDGLNTLQTAQLKYLSLLHHVDSTALELDLKKGIIHAVYSPHLDLASLSACTTVVDAIQTLHTLVIPEEREKLSILLSEEIPAFLNSGKRRQVHHFHILGAADNQPVSYQLTLLRPNPSEESATMINLWQRSSDLAASANGAIDRTTQFPDDAIHGLLTDLLRYRNDRWFTLENNGAKLAALLGYTEDELFTTFGGRLIELVVPEDREMVRNIVDQQLSSSTSIALGYRLRHKNGSTIWVLNKSHLTVEADGNEYLYGTLTDITYSQKIQMELYSNLERYQTILETMDSILFEWNPDTDRAYISQKWEQFFGYAPLTVDVMQRLSTATHFHPEDLPKVIQMFHDMKYGTLNYQCLEVRIANVHGRYHWIRMRKTAVRDKQGKLLKMVGLLIGIDEEKQAAKALQEQAERDSLTKLLNKQTGRKQIEAYLESSPRGATCAMIIIDLDNFKTINDRFGHMFGDAVLTQAAREIKRLFRAQDIITRIGGDEFKVLMKGISDRTLIENRCSQLISVCRQLFQPQLQNYPLGCSIGIALSPEHGTTYNELFKRADQALYRAKNKGKNTFCFFDANDAAFYSKQRTTTAISAPIDSDEEPGLSEQNIVQHTFQCLYSSNDFDATVNDILALIGKQTNVSRVYIFENNDDNTTCSNTFEWCNTGITPEIDRLQGISYITDIPGYENNFDEHGIFYCPDVTTLPQAAYEIVEAQGIKAMLQCAIIDNGVFRGYMGFDDCNTNRYWTKDQISTLTFFAEVLTVFLLKKRMEDRYKKLIEKEHTDQ